MTDTRLAEIHERAERISRQLRGEQEAHKNDNLLTFQTNISAMAMDSANCIDDLLSTIDRLTAENARLDAELGRCTSGNGTYISLESHDRILAKLTAELLQKTQQLTETNKALESDNYNAEMNLSRLTERLSAAVEDIRRSCYTCKWFLPIAPGCDTRACKREYEPSASMDCANWQWRGEESE